MKKILLVSTGFIAGAIVSASFIGASLHTAATVGGIRIEKQGNNRYAIFPAKATVISEEGEFSDIGIMLNMQSKSNVMSSITVRDPSDNMFVFLDLNDDGTIDTWDFSNKETLCTYGRMSGYPDTVIEDGRESKVRIDAEYYFSKNIDNKTFIEKDGELVEVEFTPTRYFKIKN